MVVLVTCKNEDPFKNEGTRVVTTFPPDFSRRSRAAYSNIRSLIWSKFELMPPYMVVLVTCKNEEDPIKNGGTRVLTRLYVDFFRHSRAANSTVIAGIWLLWLPLLPARMKKIQSKIYSYKLQSQLTAQSSLYATL